MMVAKIGAWNPFECSSKESSLAALSRKNYSRELPIHYSNPGSVDRSRLWITFVGMGFCAPATTKIGARYATKVMIRSSRHIAAEFIAVEILANIPSHEVLLILSYIAF